MKRYEGQLLPPGSRIAVVANDAIGNFVVATPLLQMLGKLFGADNIDYYGGTRTEEFQRASDLFGWSWPLHGKPYVESFQKIHARQCERGAYELVVNLELSAFAKVFTGVLCGPETWVVGPAMLPGRGELPYQADDRGDLWRDQAWISEDLCKHYPFLKSGHISELFCRLAYLDGTVPPYKVPSAHPDCDLVEVVIATSASLPEKLWPLEKWSEILRRMKEEGTRVGLVGAKPSSQREHWKGADLEDTLVNEGLVHDLRGMFTLPQVVGLLERVSKVLTLDNGILHLAVAAGTPTVGLFRNGIHRLWAPRVDFLEIVKPEADQVVADIDVEAVWEALKRVQ